MKKISLTDFWACVETHQDKKRTQAILLVFNEPPASSFATLEEARLYCINTLIVANKDAAVVNNCCGWDMETFLTAATDDMATRCAGHMDWFCDKSLAPPHILQGYQDRLMEIAREYVAQKKCHSEAKEYLCYCDEHVCPLSV